MSLIKTLRIIKGDNSSKYSFNIKEFPDISSINWIGAYTIRTKNIEGEVVLSGNLLKSTDNTSFVFYLQPANTDLLEAGRYHLSIELKNLIDYDDKIRIEVVQSPLTITKSGVLN